MKKITATAIGLLSASSLCAQTLFDLAPSEEASESIPLTWVVGASIGYDDNPTPIGNDSNESVYAVGYVGASFLSEAPQDRVEFSAQVGYVHYFDDLDYGVAPNRVSVDQSTPTGNLTLNWTRRVSDRLRFSSSNYVGFEYQPDYSVGTTAARQTGAYLRWSSDNSVGYRWSERLGTYTGVIFDGITYDDDNTGANDVSGLTFYNDFRYQLSPQTVATLTYRYSERDIDNSSADSENQFILAGIEHRFSPNTVGILRGGVQIREVDGSADGSSTSPSFEAALNTQVNEQLSVRAYGRYSVEDYARNIGGVLYDDANTLRFGVTGNYQVSQDLSLQGGINYQFLDYSDDVAPGIDEDLFNAFVGFNLQVAENVYLNGTYNFEDLGSDNNAREYDRNRFSLGVRATF
ncbi:outer membrane beta-barrel protein [bacterium]|nr:outer membrane beta-barrel protein [Akkermansiaceae bacterium]MDB4781868.1 outer membrane beta-barrel protein [Akkermansiaceae bacterium]MDC0265389.1 outer membrane beta-barrel protein [bacterium]MDC0275214.1 outer membrane beta-barrel protein [Akkermansiaceae bacterium]